MTLQEMRVQNKKSRKEVAAKLGISANAVAKYEEGRRKIGIEQVLILSSLYGESAEEIINAQISSCRNDR